jgi:hypothetical protein
MGGVLSQGGRCYADGRAAGARGSRPTEADENLLVLGVFQGYKDSDLQAIMRVHMVFYLVEQCIAR